MSSGETMLLIHDFLYDVAVSVIVETIQFFIITIMIHTSWPMFFGGILLLKSYTIFLGMKIGPPIFNG